MPALQRSSSSLALALALALALPAGASAAGEPYRPGEVVVKRGSAPSTVERVSGSVTSAVRRLRATPGVRWAHPNFVARASYVPNDPGRSRRPGGWQSVQWNLLPGTGIDAPRAWDHLIAAGRPGGQGVLVAVLDTGVAYRNRGRFRRTPDIDPGRFRRGYDFVDRDPFPLDHNGHGTHVASTIAETADNNVGLVGVAYNARILPVRVLDRLGEGDAVAIARGIRFAARRGADIINLSFEFSDTVTADQIPEILSALRYARRRGVLVVGASGNASASAVAYPARAGGVLSVGAVTEHGCMARYSNTGPGLDIAAPGGGEDADISDPGCRPDDEPGRDIVQMTLSGSVRRFGLPNGFMGTSMAAPHVSATAALVIASGVLGPDPSPVELERHLKATATDLGRKGPDTRYGAGMLNAARATEPIAPPVPPQPPPYEIPPS